MITEEEILAMDRVYLLPVLECKFDGRKRRMGMEFILKAMLFQMAEHLVYSLVACHLLRLLA
jgi:hypothetical protein